MIKMAFLTMSIFVQIHQMHHRLILTAMALVMHVTRIQINRILIAMAMALLMNWIIVQQQPMPVKKIPMAMA